MKKRYELIVYTASEKEYADSVINYIEGRNSYFAYRLYKNHCIHKSGEYNCKHLDLLCGNRDIKDIIIADNSMRNFVLSIRNGVPIKEYKGSDDDKELIYLAKYMRVLEGENDVRNRIKEDFAAFLLNHYQTS